MRDQSFLLSGKPGRRHRVAYFSPSDGLAADILGEVVVEFFQPGQKTRQILFGFDIEGVLPGSSDYGL